VHKAFSLDITRESAKAIAEAQDLDYIFHCCTSLVVIRHLCLEASVCMVGVMFLPIFVG
jgi:hypothetical protein